jgi:hypothetical protein
MKIGNSLSCSILLKSTSLITFKNQFNIILVCLPIYLSVYGSTALVDLGRIFSFLIHTTVGRTAWTVNYAVARTLPPHRTTQTQNDRIHTPNIHALSGIRTQDPIVRAGEDKLCLSPRVHRDRLARLRGHPKCLLSMRFTDNFVLISCLLILPTHPASFTFLKFNTLVIVRSIYIYIFQQAKVTEINLRYLITINTSALGWPLRIFLYRQEKTCAIKCSRFHFL